MRLRIEQAIVLLVVAHGVSALLNASFSEVANELKRDGRRKSKNLRSTSSSSGEKKKQDDESDRDETLEESSISSTSSAASRLKKYVPKSTAERKGWHKWHRKCVPCPEDMVKKWRDPTINWVCGGYQRARRTFKSDCMMRYRNCQDGTMFVKIHDHRCGNDTARWNEHFMYDYKVKLSDESSNSKRKGKDSSSSSSTQDASSSSREYRRYGKQDNQTV